MQRLVLLAAGLVVALFSLHAAAESIYRYRDPNTQRDVYVSQRDQIPAALRDQAQTVVEDGVLVDEAAGKDGPAGTVVFGDRRPEGWWEAGCRLVRQAMQTPSRVDGQRALTTMVDTDLVRRGLRPLSAEEIRRGFELAKRIGWLLLVLGSLALAGWIVMIIQAWVAHQGAWALAIFLFQPLSLLYAVKFADGKPRWWRALMALLQVAPHALLLAGGWWMYTWFTAVLHARGLG